MKKTTAYLIVLFFLTQFVFAQGEKPISGKIIVKNATAMGVHIINMVNEKEVVSDAAGNFVIMAKVDDILVFSAEHLDYQRKIVEEQDYKSQSFTMEMTSRVNKLEEVKIVKLDAVDLGILSKPAKEYTPAERRLFTATSGPLDILLNLFSGRTKMAKQDVETEKKQFLLEHLDGLYQDSFYIDNLKIKKESIKGFHYYLVEDSRFVNAISSKNKQQATFIIIELAQKYNLLNHRDEKQ